MMILSSRIPGIAILTTTRILWWPRWLVRTQLKIRSRWSITLTRPSITVWDSKLTRATILNRAHRWVSRIRRHSGFYPVKSEDLAAQRCRWHCKRLVRLLVSLAKCPNQTITIFQEQIALFLSVNRFKGANAVTITIVLASIPLTHLLLLPVSWFFCKPKLLTHPKAMLCGKAWPTWIQPGEIIHQPRTHMEIRVQQVWSGWHPITSDPQSTC